MRPPSGRAETAPSRRRNARATRAFGRDWRVLEPVQVLDFRVLGPLEVERDGALVELVGQRPRAALVLLLLEANRVVPTERLIDALWGRQPPATAPTVLRNVVSPLRKL